MIATPSAMGTTARSRVAPSSRNRTGGAPASGPPVVPATADCVPSRSRIIRSWASTGPPDGQSGVAYTSRSSPGTSSHRPTAPPPSTPATSIDRRTSSEALSITRSEVVPHEPLLSYIGRMPATSSGSPNPSTSAAPANSIARSRRVRAVSAIVVDPDPSRSSRPTTVAWPVSVADAGVVAINANLRAPNAISQRAVRSSLWTSTSSVAILSHACRRCRTDSRAWAGAGSAASRTRSAGVTGSPASSLGASRMARSAIGVSRRFAGGAISAPRAAGTTAASRVSPRTAPRRLDRRARFAAVTRGLTRTAIVPRCGVVAGRMLACGACHPSGRSPRSRSSLRSS